LLEEQKVDLAQLLSRIDEISNEMDTWIVYAEKLDGPVVDPALDDKVHNFIRRLFN
jgi:hypothetical protein